MTSRSTPRERTSGELLRLIRESGGATRAELVRSSGLSRSAVDGAVGYLMANGRLHELEAEPRGPGGGSGRPGAKLLVRGNPVAGIDFGHNHVHVAVADVFGRLLDDQRLELDVDLAAEASMDAAADLLAEIRSKHDIVDIDAVVAGIPGPLDLASGRVQSPTILSGWVGRSPARELAHRIGVPVHVENDAALGALGELYAGAGHEHGDFIYIKASHGIGASVVLNGALYRGGTGLAGEIGHTPLPSQAALCRCGNRGCLEAVVSVGALHEQVQHTRPASDPSDVRIADTDVITRRIMDEAGRVLGGVVSDLCNFINPTAVIVGGELGAESASFVEGVEEAIRRHAQPCTSAALVVLPATHGSRAELRGAVELAVRLPLRAERVGAAG